MDPTANDIMRGSRSCVMVLLSVSCLLVVPLTVRAQSFFGDAGPSRPIRLEGYWDRTEVEPPVLGQITVSPDGRSRRAFGVTALQAYKPPEEGMHVLRHSSLQPVTLTLRGRDEMVERFAKARPDERIVAYGVYRAASGTFTLDSIEIAEGVAR